MTLRRAEDDGHMIGPVLYDQSVYDFAEQTIENHFFDGRACTLSKADIALHADQLAQHLADAMCDWFEEREAHRPFLYKPTPSPFG